MPGIVLFQAQFLPRGPTQYFTDGEGGGGLRDFFGSEILAQRDFLGAWAQEGRGDFFGYCNFHQLKSTII